MSQIDQFLTYLSVLNESTLQLTKRDYEKICSIRDKVTELAVKVSQQPIQVKAAPIKEKARTISYQPVNESTILLFEEFTNNTGGRDTLAELNEMTLGQLERIADYANICNSIHLPVQSGSTSVLDRMNRNYSREWYLNRIDAIRRIIPGCAISTDIITGFCGETAEEFKDTLSMMALVKFNYAYQFSYSERPGTPAAKKMKDDIDDVTKATRLDQVIALQRGHSLEKLKAILIDAENVQNCNLIGLKSDRKLVLPGGLAIMIAAFNELKIEV